MTPRQHLTQWLPNRIDSLVFHLPHMGFRSQLSIFLMIQSVALIALAVCLFAWHFGSALLVACLVAALMALRWHDGRWWIGIHALFLPAVLFALRADIAPVWYLLAFGLCWLVFGRVDLNRAPLYLSNSNALEALASRLPEGARLLDIGAGSGTVLAWLAKKRPDLVLVGIEQAWIPWCVGRWRLPKHVVWLRGDYQNLSLAEFDAAYAFLSPAPMLDLWQKAQAEMKRNALFVSNTFTVPGVIPDETVELGDWKGGKLLLWRM